MYVCLCKGVTDSKIRQAVCAGACRMLELRDQLRVANQCGRCAKCAHGILKETRNEMKNEALQPQAAA